MKRIAALILIVCLLCTAAACGSESNEPIAQVTKEPTPEPVKDTPEIMIISDPTPEPTPGPEVFSVITYAVDDKTYEGDDLEKYGIVSTELVLNTDHTGRLTLMGDETDVEWTDDGSITVAGRPDCTIGFTDADTIVLEVYETVFTLRRNDRPQSAEAAPEPQTQPDNGTAETGAFGEPYGDSDGVIEHEKLAALYHWLDSMQSEFRYLLTFDEIGEAAGKAGCDKQDGDGKYHGAYWTDGGEGVVTVTFRESNGAWTCSSIVCSGIPKDEYDSADLSGFPMRGSSAPAGSCPVTQMTFESECSGKVVRVTAKIPETGWYAVESSSDLRIYSAPSEDKAKNSYSYIQIVFYASEEQLSESMETFEDVQRISTRKIGGNKMKGISYRYSGMEWTEYSCKLARGVWICIRLTGVDQTRGTQTDALIRSLSFRVR